MTGSVVPALIDTSVVVRYLTGDPPEMAARAADVIDSQAPPILSEIAIAATAFAFGRFGEQRPTHISGLPLENWAG